MIGTFLESLGTRLAERWVAVAAPALLFWAFAAAAYAHANGGSAAWDDARDWLAGQDGAVQLVVIAGALATVMVSAAIVQWLTLPATHALAGQWPLLSWVQWRANARRRRRIERDEERWDGLMQRLFREPRTPALTSELLRVEARLRRVSADGADRMPTRLGDALRASETRPKSKYGLDVVVCLPRIWLLLPDTARHELGEGRSRLDAAIAVWLWALLSIALSVWVWWALPIALAVLTAVYTGWILRAAQAYGDLLEATFDVHRALLYDGVGWPRPASLEDERATGEALSVYLYRGTMLQPAAA